jgi:DNA-binding winged helix-turn-helix (wHTH) protein
MSKTIEQKTISETEFKEGFTLDSLCRTLQGNGNEIRLREKLWNIAVILTEKQNMLVKRNCLIENIWSGNGYTGEQGLTHAICHLRRVFKSIDSDVKIVTIPKCGYILQSKSKNKII